MKWKRFIVSAAMASLLALSASSAFASRYHQCNAGGGNGYESTSATDCDPGNSVSNNGGG